MNENIRRAKETLSVGVAPPALTVREFLGWFDAARRGNRVVWLIRRQLEHAGLETVPDFENVWIDAKIRLTLAGSAPEAPTPAYRIDSLEAANREPVSLKPNSKLAEAVTEMMARDFSQLPVMSTPREVKGAISWKSIACRLSLGRRGAEVQEFMDPVNVIPGDTSLFDAIELIARDDFILVAAQDKTICGIVTAADLSGQFRDLAEPFLLLGEIENLIRRLLHGKFEAADLRSVRDPSDSNREVAGVADLTFGEYVRLIENEERWRRLRLNADRRRFVQLASDVRDIRNDVMHFDPQGLDPMRLDALRTFARFLRELRRFGG